MSDYDAATDPPTRGSRDDGWPPDEPRHMVDVIDEWHGRYSKRQAERQAERVGNTQFYASQAGRCLRQIQYNHLDLEPTNPFTVADSYRAELGSHMHAEIQSIILDQHPDALVEQRYEFDVGDNHRGSCYVDLILGTTPFELKTVGGFQFKKIATTTGGPPAGPRFGDRCQLAIITRAMTEAGLDVTEGVIVYLAQELVSPKLARGSEIGRFCAEFRIPADELLELSDEILADWVAVGAFTGQGRLINRWMPEFRGVVEDVKGGNGYSYAADGETITGSFDAWPCRGYCPHEDRCISHGSLKTFAEVGVDVDR